MVLTLNRNKLLFKFQIVLLFTLFSVLQVVSQKRYKIYEDYIGMYSYISVAHMQKYKIPASITLAQGILESGAGMSELTKRSNNHFGIKCHREWKGSRVFAKDDTPNDCFRKYNKAEDSFEDHSQFIVKGVRYSFLFKLPSSDYKGWAEGLQKSGYATDKAYANKLIKLIEDYELYLYDRGNYNKSNSQISNNNENLPSQKWLHQPFKTHGLVYVLAIQGDTYEGISAEFNCKLKDLLKYNEVPKGFPLNKGDIVYFEKKKSRADKPYFDHIVEIGESMHSISQKYGLKVKNLYKMNKRNYEYVPEEGDVLKLR
ncbi:MAG: glucosaminidase domain-containing protein [Candidatus Saccharimonadaceae bacterium]